jgi:hypothetical protein
VPGQEVDGERGHQRHDDREQAERAEQLVLEGAEALEDAREAILVFLVGADERLPGVARDVRGDGLLERSGAGRTRSAAASGPAA